MSEKLISPLIKNQVISSNVDPRQRAWLEVDSRAIASNTTYLKNLLKKECSLMAVVKADGYGHGAETVAKAALLGGANSLGVATLQEGLELRKARINCPILLLGNLTNDSELAACFKWDLIPTLSSLREALLCQNLSEGAGKKFKVHIKVDTGMARLGCDLSEAIDLVNSIKKLNNLRIDGIYSHLALADGELYGKSKLVTELQQKRFEFLIQNLSGYDQSFCFHLANSAGTLRDESLHYNMVRIGLSIYGYSPISNLNRTLSLQPAMSVKARVSLLRNVPVDTGIGYGHTFKTKRDSSIAVIGIGYADGISRALSGKIFGIFEDNFLPQIGTIAMDQLALDVTDYPSIKVGDVVTFLGRDGSKSITPEQWCNSIGSIPWEVLCGFKHRLPRVIV